MTWLAQYDARSTPTHPYGYGRVDAFGIIMNEVFGRDLQQPDNVRVPNAPVSYPFLWTSPQLDWVQWNGSANNPFGRNVGEVLGVFGHVNLTGPLDQLGWSTARPRELFELEKLVSSLTPPKWPAMALGPIDSEKAARGRALYSASRGDEPSCEACHALPDENGHYPMTPTAENRFGVSFIETRMTGLGEIGTDPAMAINFATRKVNTGGLAPFLPAPFTGATEVPAPALLSILVDMAVSDGIAQSPFSAAEKCILTALCLSTSVLADIAPDQLAAAAVERTTHKVVYDGSYYRIPYPGGDIPEGLGVCTDVVIRSYRTLGIDLQALVHKDMAANFSVYPSKRLWGLKRPDANIDHRRVPNLQVFFARYVRAGIARIGPGGGLSARGYCFLGAAGQSASYRDRRRRNSLGRTTAAYRTQHRTRSPIGRHAVCLSDYRTLPILAVSA